MVVEGCHALADGVAHRPGDIDVAMVHGFGFPRHEGGPMWWATGQSESDVRAGSLLVAEASGGDVSVELVLDVLRGIRADA
jgi:3-hydroxyacyl-CoA dehydrogenase